MCQRCLEAWLYYGHPPACPFKVRERVSVINPATKRPGYRGTIYRLDYDWDLRRWVAAVLVGSGERGLAIADNDHLQAIPRLTKAA